MQTLNTTELAQVTGGVTDNCTDSTKESTSTGPRPGETLLEYYLRTQAQQQEGNF